MLSLSGINRDGEDLIRGYDYKRKKVEEAAADLAERAIDMDYLAPGGTIYVGVSSAHEDWADEMKRDLTWELDGRLGSDIHISADPKPDESPESGTAREAETAFPAAPPVSETVPAAVQTAPAAHQTVPTAHPNDNWNEDSDEQRDEDWDDTTNHGSDDNQEDDWDDAADDDSNNGNGDNDDNDDDDDDSND